MASENVDDWEEPLPSVSSTIRDEQEEEEKESEEKQQLAANEAKLQMYVTKMAYRPVEPPIVSRPRLEQLAQPNKMNFVQNYEMFDEYQSPVQRKHRLKRMAGKNTAISTEQFEQIMRGQKVKERKKEDLFNRKQELYYEMLTKLESQCRTQYLNVLVGKFANFIAKLATTMTIPPQLVEPYARMQRGIFCNILRAIGVQPFSQAATYYTSQEALEHEVCHKLAHALLHLIIKALNSASMCPDDIKPLGTDFEMDHYIKDRLMCAAEKKLLNARHQSKTNQSNPLNDIFRKCQNFGSKTCQ